ncbi:MAG: hypothetical protein M3276_01525 [Actinomycetota bacterium]|nr:hypothetical protein [Actinomycetota bacterium]
MAVRKMTEAAAWWADDRFRLDLADGLIHINTARAVDNRSPGAVLGACESLFKALNKLMSAFQVARPRGQAHETDTSTLCRLIAEVPPAEADALWDSGSVKQLIDLEPPIEDHFVLRRYLLTHDIPPTEREEARAAHERLKRRYGRYTDRPNTENRRKLGAALAELLWVVGSNLAHGEKTAAGRDDARNERNRQVSAVTVGVIHLLDVVLGHPNRKLLVYGTLAPGRADHSQLAAVDGTWIEITVRGVLGEVEGLPAFRWNPHGKLQQLSCLSPNTFPTTGRSWTVSREHGIGGSWCRTPLLRVSPTSTSTPPCDEHRGSRLGPADDRDRLVSTGL